MGVQIILLFIFHFTETCMKSDINYTESAYNYFTYIRSSGVDAFLFLSGMGLYFSWTKQPDYGCFLKKRFWKILPSYFMVAVPVWFWVDIIYSRSGGIKFLQDLFFVSFFTEDVKTYWYVLMIIICYLVFPFFYKYVAYSKDKITEQMSVLTICTSFTLFIVMIQNYHNSLYENIDLALFRFPVFIVGILLGKYVYENRKIKKHYIYILLGICVLLLGPLEFYDVRILGFYIRALLNLSLSLLLIIFFEYISKKNNRWCAVGYRGVVKVLSCFGSCTYEIYLVHLSVRKIMNLLGYEVCYIRYAVIWVLISFVLSIILKKCADGIYGLAIKPDRNASIKL